MRDRVAIAAGLALVVALVALPVWHHAALGTPGRAPALARPRGDRCVLPRAEMRRAHMTLLVDWRARVVRDHERTYVAADGTTVERSLTRTCLGCHGTKAEFCDRCHAWAAARPACFDCHVDPGRAPAPTTAEAFPRAGARGRDVDAPVARVILQVPGASRC